MFLNNENEIQYNVVVVCITCVDYIYVVGLIMQVQCTQSIHFTTRLDSNNIL